MDTAPHARLIIGNLLAGRKKELLTTLEPSYFDEPLRGIFQMLRQGATYLEIAKVFSYSLTGTLMSESETFPLTSPDVDDFVESVKDAYLKKKLMQFSEQVGDRGRNDIVADLRAMLSESVSLKKRDHITEYELQEKNIRENEDGVVGIRTGYEVLDRRVSGMVPGQTWVVGGYSGYGKSYFAQNVISNLLDQTPTRRTMVISTEMVGTAYMKRLIGIRSGVNAGMVMCKLPSPLAEARDLAKSDIMVAIEDGHLVLDDTSRSIGDMVASIRNEHEKRALDLVVVDFIQQVQGDKKKYEVLQEATNALQALAIELRITMMLLSQMNNEAIKDRDGSLYGYKGAGEIAEVADVGIVIRRELNEDKTFSSLFQVELRKVRYGEPGVIDMYLHFPGGKLVMERDIE